MLPDVKSPMRAIRVVALLVVGLSACEQDDDASSHRSEPLVAETTEPQVTPTSPDTSETLPTSVASPAAPSTTLAPAIVSVLNAESKCGPTDGPWVEGTVVATEAVVVFARLSFDGVTYGESDIVTLIPGEQTTIGFDPQRPDEAFDKVGEFEVLIDGTTTPLAVADVLLRLPDDVSCG